jgi:hypothetical protein
VLQAELDQLLRMLSSIPKDRMGFMSEYIAGAGAGTSAQAWRRESADS